MGSPPTVTGVLAVVGSAFRNAISKSNKKKRDRRNVESPLGRIKLVNK